MLCVDRLRSLDVPLCPTSQFTYKGDRDVTKKVVTFGEIMMRLCPPGFQRFVQARSFDVTYAGGEANVAVSLANYGIPVDFVTRLPKNDVGEACRNFVRQYGVGTDNIVWGGDRLGIYFLETGAMQRGSMVIYDRAGSSIATIEPGMIDWKTVFAGADWFHWTGITPAISKGAADVCLEAAKAARADGPDRLLRPELPRQAVEVGQEGRRGHARPGGAVRRGHRQRGRRREGLRHQGRRRRRDQPARWRPTPTGTWARSWPSASPRLKTIAITLRGSLSASHNTWSGVLWDNGKVYTGRTYDITHIVDRVGGGDAFVGGLIYGLKTYGADKQKALDFAVAASASSTPSWATSTWSRSSEVEKLMGGDASGRVAR